MPICLEDFCIQKILNLFYCISDTDYQQWRSSSPSKNKSKWRPQTNCNISPRNAIGSYFISIHPTKIKRFSWISCWLLQSFPCQVKHISYTVLLNPQITRCNWESENYTMSIKRILTICFDRKNVLKLIFSISLNWFIW